jgi:Tfp pilus assembly protein PilO
VNRRAPILVGVVSIVLVVASVFLLVLPKSAEIAKTQEDLTAAEQQENTLRIQLRALQEAQDEAPQTRKAIQRVETQIPSTADLPALIRLLRDAADRSAVDLFQFSPSNPTVDTGSTFSTISTAVNVTGSYFSLDEFLYRLETLPRAAKVTNVSVAPGSSTASTTDTTSTASPAPTTSATSGVLNMQLTVEFYTSDLSAGPGSVPGPTTTTGA